MQKMFFVFMHMKICAVAIASSSISKSDPSCVEEVVEGDIPPNCVTRNETVNELCVALFFVTFWKGRN